MKLVLQPIKGGNKFRIKEGLDPTQLNQGVQLA